MALAFEPTARLTSILPSRFTALKTLIHATKSIIAPDNPHRSRTQIGTDVVLGIAQTFAAGGATYQLVGTA
jgi:hypothetical protein